MTTQNTTTSAPTKSPSLVQAVLWILAAVLIGWLFASLFPSYEVDSVKVAILLGGAMLAITLWMQRNDRVLPYRIIGLVIGALIVVFVPNASAALLPDQLRWPTFALLFILFR